MKIHKRLIAATAAAVLTVTLAVPAFAAEPTFRDVPVSYWGYTAIEKAVGAKMLYGVGNGKFEPERSMTGGELLSMLTNYFCPEDIETNETVLTAAGVAGKWYSGNLYAAMKHGYLDGLDRWEIDFDAPCTREQLVRILYNIAGQPAADPAVLNSYTDKNQISDYAVNALAWSVTNKIVSGMTPTTVAPQNPTARGQAARIVVGYLENVRGVVFPEVVIPAEDTRGQNSDGTTNAAYVNSLCDVGKSNDYPTTGDASSPNANGFYTKANVDISGAKLQYDVIPHVNAFLAKHAELKETSTVAPWDTTMHWVTSDEQEEYTLLRAKEACSYFEHKRPDNTGILSSENLYRGNSGAEVVIKAWENSSGHAATMLSAGYTDTTTCVASCNGVWVMTLWADNMPIWVKTFASNNYYWDD